MSFIIVSWLAMMCAISGRALTALKSNRMRFWGFFAYVVGSILWIIYSVQADQHALAVQNIILIFFSILGLYNNWKK